MFTHDGSTLKIMKKSYTWEEGGALLFFAFINELEKQLIIKKTVEVGQ